MARSWSPAPMRAKASMTPGPGLVAADVADDGAGAAGAQGAACGEPGQLVVGAARGVAEHAVDGALAAQHGEQAVGEEVGGTRLRERAGAGFERAAGRRAGGRRRGRVPSAGARPGPVAPGAGCGGPPGSAVRVCLARVRAGCRRGGGCRGGPVGGCRGCVRPGHHLVHGDVPVRAGPGGYRAVTCCWGSCTGRSGRPQGARCAPVGARKFTYQGDGGGRALAGRGVPGESRAAWWTRRGGRPGTRKGTPARILRPSGAALPDGPILGAS